MILVPDATFRRASGCLIIVQYTETNYDSYKRY